MNRFKIIIGIMLLSLFALSKVYGQSHKPNSVEWVSFDELTIKMRKEVRPIIIHLVAPWCTYCKMMDQKVFTQTHIQELLQDNFYCVKLDAESQDPIRFLGRTYTFKPTGPKSGTHELATLLGKQNGSIEYPTLVVLGDQMQVLFRKVGYTDASSLEQLLISTMKLNLNN